MSLVSYVGGEGNVLASGPEHARIIELPHPVLTNEDLERLRWVDRQHFQAKTISICFQAKPGRMEHALERLRREAEEYVLDGYEVLILSDRPVDSDHAAIPALLAVSTVHHHLIRRGLRSRTGLIVETGEAREVHHFADPAGLRRIGHQPLPGARDHRGHAPARGCCQRPSAPRRPASTTSRPSTRGSSRRCPRWASRPSRRTSGPRSSRPWASATRSSRSTSRGPSSRIGGIGVATIEREVLMRHEAAYVDLDDEQRAASWAASTSGADGVSATSTTRRPSPACSRPCARVTTSGTGSTPASSTTTPSRPSPCATCSSSPTSRPSPSTRSSQSSASCAASPAAPCPSAPSPGRRTRRWPSP